MSDDWQRLGTYVVQRRNELGYGSQAALEEASGVSYRTISRLETGHGIGKNNLRKIEQALRWQVGSMEQVLAGGVPMPIEDAGYPMDETSRARRVTILAATPEQLVEMRQLVQEVLGSEQADEFLRGALELREQYRGN
jgi:transcriptional regulator with XRE-family HTH domain